MSAASNRGQHCLLSPTSTTTRPFLLSASHERTINSSLEQPGAFLSTSTDAVQHFKNPMAQERPRLSILDYPLEQVACTHCSFFLYSIQGQSSEPYMREHMLECKGLPSEHRRYYRNSRSLTPAHTSQSSSYHTYVYMLDEILHGPTSSATSQSKKPAHLSTSDKPAADDEQTDIEPPSPKQVYEDVLDRSSDAGESSSDEYMDDHGRSAWPSTSSAAGASTSSRDTSSTPPRRQTSVMSDGDKRKRKAPRGTEEAQRRRYEKLADDRAIVNGSVEFTQVQCEGCRNIIKLDKRQKYYSTLWEKHRDRCTELAELRQLECEGKDTSAWVPPTIVEPSRVPSTGPIRTRKSLGRGR